MQLHRDGCVDASDLLSVCIGGTFEHRKRALGQAWRIPLHHQSYRVAVAKHDELRPIFYKREAAFVNLVDKARASRKSFNVPRCAVDDAPSANGFCRENGGEPLVGIKMWRQCHKQHHGAWTVKASLMWELKVPLV